MMPLSPAILKSMPMKIGVLAAILASHLVPSAVIGFGVVIPGSCIEGINPLTMGYVASLVGFIPTFTFGAITAWQLGRASAVAASAPTTVARA